MFDGPSRKRLKLDFIKYNHSLSFIQLHLIDELQPKKQVIQV